MLRHRPESTRRRAPSPYSRVARRRRHLVLAQRERAVEEPHRGGGGALDGGIVELNFDLKGESVNKFNRLTLNDLRQAVDAIKADASVKGVVVTSGKDVFIVGADITEFVPLPFVHMASPVYLKRAARRGPTWREVVLMHAIGRIAYRGSIDNVQGSWVKLGIPGVLQLLQGGVNDVGGTLMDENISRAAGATHGQGLDPEDLHAPLQQVGRRLRREQLRRRWSAMRHSHRRARVIGTHVAHLRAFGPPQ